jgi:hypothetical protein
MRGNLKTRLRMVLILGGALAFCAPVWSDAGIPGGVSKTERTCYCDCDAQAGSPMCTHMCDLAKYEDRSWATSCHKKQDSEPDGPSATTPGVRSRKDNRIQEARK